MVVRIIIAVALLVPGLFMVRFARDIVDLEFELSEQEDNRRRQEPTLFQVFIEAFRVLYMLPIALVVLLVGISLLFLALLVALDRPLVGQLS
ncbi:MAG: hypothetical protein HY666_03840 [Chloroflexi bacterium]|nr:hypothetical protein [Chloroflexota bacterium]